MRAGKTTPLVWKLINYAIEYPGIAMMLTRWTQDALDAHEVREGVARVDHLVGLTGFQWSACGVLPCQRRVLVAALVLLLRLVRCRDADWVGLFALSAVLTLIAERHP